MIALDASMIIAHLSAHDAHHSAATEFLGSAADQQFVMHPLNLAEVLVGGVRVGRGAQLLRDLERLGIEEARPPAGEALRLADLRASTGLKMPDCCVLDTALTTEATLATFDQALASAARRLGVAVAP